MQHTTQGLWKEPVPDEALIWKTGQILSKLLPMQELR